MAMKFLLKNARMKYKWEILKAGMLQVCIDSALTICTDSDWVVSMLY